MSSADFDWTQVSRRLERLYGDQSADCLSRIRALADRYTGVAVSRRQRDQRDVVLITYGDQVQDITGTPLSVLREFLLSAELQQLISTVHLLPFFPYSSDDGFSVIDYRQVNPDVGTWDDVSALNEHFELMFDLVLNHCSSQSGWFQDYVLGREPYRRFFIECSPETDLSAVTRPRTSPLLTEIQTSAGPRHVWTTFSPDQVDLDFREPDVLLEMMDVLLMYVSRGATIIRLDAIAYLWKKAGTHCIHLDETHEVVKLMRDVIDAVAPGVLILTETNVPHAENVSYFGDGDEAHLIYQFSLPPLLLDAFVHHDAGPISKWLAELDAPAPGTSYFNFTASHDGIGVRPLEGLVGPDRLESLVSHVKNRGGRVSTRGTPDGRHLPYELNIAFVDALSSASDADVESHAERFLASQAVMLALQGIPGMYFHSLVGSQNDEDGVRESGQPRRINRHKYSRADLAERLTSNPLQSHIFGGYQNLLRQRIKQPAFHPDAKQEVIATGNPQILSFVRTSADAGQRIVVATNFGETPSDLALPTALHASQKGFRELISGRDEFGARITVPPRTTIWLTRK